MSGTKYPGGIESLIRANSIHRAVYVDPRVFALEQERIFGRAWIYVGHESEIRNPGDYVLAQLGRDEVILVRQEDGGIVGLHNRCAHRGARVLPESRGNRRRLVCDYHAWSYRLDGALDGVPLAEGYAREINDAGEKHGLARVPRVESYRGFIFASQSSSGTGLKSFLGDMSIALDNFVDRAPAASVTQRGGRLRMEYRGNWKLFMENATDLVHPGFVHASSVAVARRAPQLAEDGGVTGQALQMLLANGLRLAEWNAVGVHSLPEGHAFMGGFYRDGVIAAERPDPVFRRYRDALVARHGEAKTDAILAVDRFNNLIWPNLSVNSRFQTLRVVQPVAVDRTVVSAFCFELDGAPAEMFELSLRFLNTAASPASMVASDDLEIFERCQSGLEDSALEWIDVSRGAVEEHVDADGARHAPGTSELPIRAQFEAWKRYMVEAAG